MMSLISYYDLALRILLTTLLAIITEEGFFRGWLWYRRSVFMVEAIGVTDKKEGGIRWKARTGL